MHTHTHTHSYTHASTCKHTCIHTRTHTHTHIHCTWKNLEGENKNIGKSAGRPSGVSLPLHILVNLLSNSQMCSTHTRTNTHIHIHTYSPCNTFTLQIKGKFQCIICNILHWLWNVIEMHDVYQCVCYTVFVIQVYVQFPKIRTLINKMRLLLSKSQKCTNTN